MFDEYFKILSEAKYKTKNGGLKILIHKQILQRLSIVFAQVKAGNISEKVKNEIRQIKYSSYPRKEVTKNVCNNIMNSIKL